VSDFLIKITCSFSRAGLLFMTNKVYPAVVAIKNIKLIPKINRGFEIFMRITKIDINRRLESRVDFASIVLILLLVQIYMLQKGKSYQYYLLKFLRKSDLTSNALY
jgi:hypothetical protein